MVVCVEGVYPSSKHLLSTGLTMMAEAQFVCDALATDAELGDIAAEILRQCLHRTGLGLIPWQSWWTDSRLKSKCKIKRALRGPIWKCMMKT